MHRSTDLGDDPILRKIEQASTLQYYIHLFTKC